MRIAAYLRANQSRTNERVVHFGEQLNATFSTREKPIECDLAIQAGFEISPAMADAMSRGIPFIILENPVWHYGDKFHSYTYGYNGLAGLSGGSVLRGVASRPHPDLAPKSQGGATIIFSQTPNDKSLRGCDIHEWVRRMQAEHPEAEVRRHPAELTPNDPPLEPFEDCLRRCGKAITYTSTVGAEAVIRGIPTIVDHPGGWAYAVRSTPEVPFPHRELWIHDLSYRHWNTFEAVDVDLVLSYYDQARAQAERGEYDDFRRV